MGVSYRKRGASSWEIQVKRHGERAYQNVHGTKDDVKAVVRELLRLEASGRNVVEALRLARQPAPAASGPAFPTLRQALPEWIAGKVDAGDLRASTGKSYRSRCSTWLYPHVLPDGRALGDLPVNAVEREMLGGVIEAVKRAGKSTAIVEGIRNPVKGYYQSIIEHKTLAGPNPAADLAYFVGKQGGKRKRTTRAAHFAREEAPQLVGTAKALWPRWAPFVLTGLLAGLRWGESAALYASDVDWDRGWIFVQRTWSDKGRRIEACKDGEMRRVKAPAALLDALRAHREAMSLEASVKNWTPEQRQLMFPTPAGRIARHGHFYENVWQPLLSKAGLPHRKYHATRHSYATWMLDEGNDVRWVQAQLGHATIAQTVDTYAHLDTARHAAGAEALTRYLTP